MFLNSKADSHIGGCNSQHITMRYPKLADDPNLMQQVLLLRLAVAAHIAWLSLLPSLQAQKHVATATLNQLLWGFLVAMQAQTRLPSSNGNFRTLSQFVNKIVRQTSEVSTGTGQPCLSLHSHKKHSKSVETWLLMLLRHQPCKGHRTMSAKESKLAIDCCDQ